MKALSFTLIALALFSCGKKSDKKAAASTAEKNSEVVVTEELKLLATDFQFTEGPAANGDGDIYFTDIPENRIYKWTTSDSLKLHKENTNGANGLYFDKDQNLWICEGSEARITLTTPDGDYSVIASTYKGEPFNRTNDIWVNPQGGAYFTDPKYGADQDQLPQGSMQVYHITPDKQTVLRVTGELTKPNGLIGTPDGKLLYITDPGAGKTYSYDIQKDGMLANKKLFVEFGGDGMTIDQQGNVYLTTGGQPQVDVFSPDGELLTSIPVPEQPSNVAFGGEDNNELYITARKSLYRVGLNRRGVN